VQIVSTDLCPAVLQCFQADVLGELLRFRQVEALGLQGLDHCGDIAVPAYRHPLLAAQGCAVEGVQPLRIAEREIVGISTCSAPAAR
jgi:hypothetical protein